VRTAIVFRHAAQLSELHIMATTPESETADADIDAAIDRGEFASAVKRLRRARGLSLADAAAEVQARYDARCRNRGVAAERTLVRTRLPWPLLKMAFCGILAAVSAVAWWMQRR
jgi:hypothetical protein